LTTGLKIIIAILDHAAQALAWLGARAFPSRFTGGAFVTWDSDCRRPRLDAWTEPGAFNMQLGRLEVIVDLARA
jgi:hypothetical protein